MYEAEDRLAIHGHFGTEGFITIDDTILPHFRWSDSLIMLTIPDIGKGSFGIVKVHQGDFLDSAWLTKWILPIETEWQYVQRGGVSENEWMSAAPQLRLDVYGLRRTRKDVSISSIDPNNVSQRYFKYDNGKQFYRDTSFDAEFHSFGGSTDRMELWGPSMIVSHCGTHLDVWFDSTYAMHLDGTSSGDCRCKSSIAPPLAPPPAFLQPEVLRVVDSMVSSEEHSSIVYDLLGREIMRYEGKDVPPLRSGFDLIMRGTTLLKLWR